RGGSAGRPSPSQHSDRIVAGFGFERDPAQFGEGIDPGLAPETAIAAGLHTSEGHLRFVRHRGRIDMADARLDLPRDLETARSVPGEHRCGKTVLRVVRELDRMCLV